MMYPINGYEIMKEVVKLIQPAQPAQPDEENSTPTPERSITLGKLWSQVSAYLSGPDDEPTVGCSPRETVPQK